MSLLKRAFYSCVLSLVGIHAIAQNRDLPLFKVGIIADVQYCDAENSGSRYYRSSLGKLEQAMDRFQKENVGFIINLGDLIDRDFSSFKPLLDIMEPSGIPVHNVPGNHDFSVTDNKKKKVPKMLGLARPYDSFVRENWRIIKLDGTDISTYGNKKGSRKHKMAQSILDSLKAAKAVNAFKWNSGIGKKQLGWFQNQLSAAEAAGENVIVLCHFPVFPKNGTENLWNDNELREVMEQFDGQLVSFNGHTHRSNFNFNKEVFYVSFRGMVEKEENSFAIAEVYSDSIVIHGFGEELDRRISWGEK